MSRCGRTQVGLVLCIVASFISAVTSNLPQTVTFSDKKIDAIQQLRQYDRSHAYRGEDRWLPGHPGWVPDNNNCLTGKTLCSGVTEGAPSNVVDGNVETSFMWSTPADNFLIFDLQACHQLSKVKIRSLSSGNSRDVRVASLLTSESMSGPWTVIVPTFEVASRMWNYDQTTANPKDVWTTGSWGPSRRLQSVLHKENDLAHLHVNTKRGSETGRRLSYTNDPRYASNRTGQLAVIPYNWHEFVFPSGSGRYWKLFVYSNYGDRNSTGFNEIGFYGQECPGVPAAPVVNVRNNLLPVDQLYFNPTYSADIDVTVTNETYIDVIWPAVDLTKVSIADPTSFEVSWRLGSSTTWNSKTQALTSLSSRITGLQSYTEYIFRVRIVNNAGETTAWSRQSKSIWTSIDSPISTLPVSIQTPVVLRPGYRGFYFSVDADCNSVGRCDFVTGTCQCDVTHYGHKCERIYSSGTA